MSVDKQDIMMGLRQCVSLREKRALRSKRLPHFENCTVHQDRVAEPAIVKCPSTNGYSRNTAESGPEKRKPMPPGTQDSCGCLRASALFSGLQSSLLLGGLDTRRAAVATAEKASDGRAEQDASGIRGSTH